MLWNGDMNDGGGGITYTVSEGYAFRAQLRELGFSYSERSKSWTLTVHREQPERKRRIEEFLHKAVRDASRAAHDRTNRTQAHGSQAAWFDGMLKDQAWLYQGEIRLLQGMLSQEAAGRPLSATQRSKIKQIQTKVNQRKNPHFVPGGSPGLGKRRR